MSNSSPILIPVPLTIAAGLGPGVSVANLGASLRKLLFDGAAPTDQVELWGSNDGVSFARVDRVLASLSETSPVILAGVSDGISIDDRSLFYAALRTGGSGAATLSVVGEDVGFQPNALTEAFRARNVGPTGNVANLAAFTVAGNDGVTNVAGDVVFLYAQTDPTENGPWVVGGVSAGAAPLTRPVWWASGATIGADTEVAIASGAVFGTTTWQNYTAAAIVVDSDDPNVAPQYVAQRAVLALGTVAITNVPILSSTGKTQIGINRITPVATALTVQYNPSAITAGAIGVASLTVDAQLAAGTINVADLSTLNVSITNS
jgi:hypothetical protein